MRSAIALAVVLILSTGPADTRPAAHTSEFGAGLAPVQTALLTNAARPPLHPAVDVPSARRPEAAALPVALSTPGATPRATTRPVAALSGLASWLAAPDATAAAGPALRRFLGRRWRGTEVIVTANGRSVRVQLTDWMANPKALVDLNPRSFQEVCGPLSRGLCRVTVFPMPAMPETDR